MTAVQPLRVAIGVMAHNEGSNIDSLLRLLTQTQIVSGVVDQILVVSSASTDATNRIVSEWAARDPRVQLTTESERRGKAWAINIFLAALPPKTDVCVLVSGDVLPAPDAMERLIAPFHDRSVGMTGGHPVPSNPDTTLIDRVVHFQWALHHRVAATRPKLGELVAFRNTYDQLDPATPVDEASLEAMFTVAGARLQYVPEAFVYNHGPSDLRQFLRQRRRIWHGHLWLRDQTGYRVSTYHLRKLAVPGLREMRNHGFGVGTVMAAAGLEAVARLLGTWDRFRRRTPTVWKIVGGTKAPTAPSEPPPTHTDDGRYK